MAPYIIANLSLYFCLPLQGAHPRWGGHLLFIRLKSIISELLDKLLRPGRV